MNSIIIENVEAIDLFFYFFDDFEKVYVFLIKFVDFDNVDKLKYEIIFI